MSLSRGQRVLGQRLAAAGIGIIILIGACGFAKAPTKGRMPLVDQRMDARAPDPDVS
jgi:hypothetical protein